MSEKGPLSSRHRFVLSYLHSVARRAAILQVALGSSSSLLKARREIYLRETLCSDGTPRRSPVLSLLAIGAGGGELLPVKAGRCLPSR